MSADQPAPPRSDTPNQFGDGLGLLFAGGIVLASLSMVYNGARDYLVPAYRAKYVYVQTAAPVLETTTEVQPGHEGSEIYHPKVRLRYDGGVQVREEWARLDWSAPYETKERAEADLRGYPVGGQVTVWYDPTNPGRVVVTQDGRLGLGWMIVGLGLLLPAAMIGLPIVLLALTAYRHWFRFEQTTGRVVRAEVREVPGAGDQPAFRPVLAVECDKGASLWQTTIPGGDFADRTAAEQELRTLQSLHPVGAVKAIWFDPRDVEPPTFEPLTTAAFVAGVLLTLAWPVLAVCGGLVGVVRSVAGYLTTPRPAPAQVSAVSPARRFLLVAASAFILTLTARFVFYQDYQFYFEYEPVMGVVTDAKALPVGPGDFDPRVRYKYAVGGLEYERATHAGWHGVQLRPMSQAEAEATLDPYPVGSQILVWYDPANPIRGLIKRYIRWHLYPIVIPPLWVLIAQTRRLLRRE
jgi:hypothetical protein